MVPHIRVWVCFLFENRFYIKERKLFETRRNERRKQNQIHTFYLVEAPRRFGDVAIKWKKITLPHIRRRRGWRRLRRYTYFNWTCRENMMCSIQKQALRRFAMRTLHQKWNQNIIWSTFAIIAVCRLPKDHVKHSLFILQKCSAAAAAVATFYLLFGNQSMQREHQIYKIQTKSKYK